MKTWMLGWKDIFWHEALNIIAVISKGLFSCEVHQQVLELRVGVKQIEWLRLIFNRKHLIQVPTELGNFAGKFSIRQEAVSTKRF